MLILKTSKWAGVNLREKAAKSSANVSGGRGIAALNKLEEAVNAQEASAEAWEELASTSSAGRQAALENKYANKSNISDLDISKYMSPSA